MKRAAGAILVMVLTVEPLRAQEQGALAKLSGLSVGTPVQVTTVSGVLIEGEVKSTTEERIVVVTKNGEERQVARGDIQIVAVTRRDSIWNGVFAGAALGFGGGAGLGAAWFYGSGRYGAKPPGYGREFISGIAVVGSVVGAFIGWRLDAARTRRDVIYTAASAQ